MKIKVEWMTTVCLYSYRHVWTQREEVALKRKAYNKIYSGNFLNVLHMFNNSLDNWGISLMTSRYYFYKAPWSEGHAAQDAKYWDSGTGL